MGILSTFIQPLRRYRALIQTSLGVTGMIVSASTLGWLQLFELTALDQFFRLRPDRSPDSRIVVLEVGESDISHLGQWPLNDAKLAEILVKVRDQRPLVVGLDLYRDLPVSPGEEELAELVQSMPNLIGVEKAAGEPVAPPPLLEERGQVALADLVLDLDNKVRRGIVSYGSTPETYQVGLGARLALHYLAEVGIFPEPVETDPTVVQLGATQIRRLESHAGQYHNVDDRGYQIMLNYRGKQGSFQRFSMEAFMDDEFPSDALTGKIVLIGTTAPSLNDAFLTPYNTSFAHRSDSLPGVYIHATMTRQILEAAETDTPPLQGLPQLLEWFWIAGWTVFAVTLASTVLQSRRLPFSPIALILGTAFSLSISLVFLSYLCFLLGFWMPVVAPTLAIIVASVLRLANQNQHLNQLASSDQLTQVANRRLFDQTLRENLQRQRPLSLILCDVDYFKPFNDTYGHLAGDECLKQVAHAIQQAVRGGDLVARYGGEEFAVVLPNTTNELATEIAERIRLRVMQLQIEHCQSEVHEHVTLSCGVVSKPEAHSLLLQAGEFIDVADQALYQAKQQGRNSVVQRTVDTKKS